MKNKPYHIFIYRSKDIPQYYNKKNNKQSERSDTNYQIPRNSEAEIKNLINSLFSDKKNIKLLSSILCYLFMTFDAKHHNIISNIENYIERHQNITIPFSSEIPIIIDDIINAISNKIKNKVSNNNHIQKEIEGILHILLTECIHHTKTVKVHTTSLKHKYPFILNFFKTVLIPIAQKHDIVIKLTQAFNDAYGNKLVKYLHDLHNNAYFIKETIQQDYFIQMRNMIYKDEECKKAIGYNIYIFLSKKTGQLSHIRYVNNLLTKNNIDIHKILTCISENPNFAKRLLKKLLHRFLSNSCEQTNAPIDKTDDTQKTLTSMAKSFLTKSTIQTKNLMRKCRSISNNVIVVTKMGRSLFTIGKTLENKFPGISKTLLL